MIWYLRRLVCLMLGHARDVWLSEVWSYNPEVGRYRVCTLRCPRCESVTEIRSAVEGEPWS